MKFKDGDKVRIIAPTNTGNWNSEMDKTIGEIVTLETSHDFLTKYPWVIGEWNYSEEWLELVNNPMDNYDYAMGIV